MKRRWPDRLIFIFVILLSLIVVGELTLRGVGAAYREWYLKIDNQFVGDSPVKIACFGNSFTYGAGAPPKTDYPLQLEQLLQKQYGSTTCQVLNLAKPGSNSSEILIVMDRAFADGLRPDFVLIATGNNNYWNWHLATSFLPGSEPLRQVHSALHGLRLWRFMSVLLTSGPTAAGKLYRQNNPKDGADPAYQHRLEHDRDWIVDWIVADMTAIVTLCRNHGAQPVLVTYPISSNNIRTAHEKAAAKLHLPVADCHFFGGMSAADTAGLISPDGWHPNQHGYTRVARIVRATLTPLIDEKLAR